MTGQILCSIGLMVLGISCCAWTVGLIGSRARFLRNAKKTWRSPGAVVFVSIATVQGLIILGALGIVLVNIGYSMWPIVWGVK